MTENEVKELYTISELYKFSEEDYSCDDYPLDVLISELEEDKLREDLDSLDF